tara:strand:- start:3268 stop:3924 length:657 start_codon:yes stop_codon:yes gene_type:complete
MKSKFLGYTKDIVVIDNIVSTEKADAWEKHVTNNNFAWYLLRDIDPSKISDKSNHRTAYDNNTVNTVQFTHDLYNENDDGSYQYQYAKELIDECCKKFEIVPYYFRLKFNLLTNNYLMTKDKYNTPHIDNKYVNSYSMIYYVNDSDGDTIIFNETCNDETMTRPDKLTIKQRIEPKKNRAVLFRGNYFHTSSNPMNNETRIVLNVNLANQNELVKTYD